jgi:hypothetical protein
VRTILVNLLVMVASVVAAFAAFAAFLWAAADPGLGGGGTRETADHWWFLPLALFGAAFVAAAIGLRATRTQFSLIVAAFSALGAAAMLALSPFW